MATVEAAVERREAEIRAEFRAAKRSFLGVRRIRKQRWTDTPETAAPRRGVSPRVAGCKWRRIEALQRLASFCDDYRRALPRWIAGERDVIFPAGCYQLRRQFGVRCADS